MVIYDFLVFFSPILVIFFYSSEFALVEIFADGGESKVL